MDLVIVHWRQSKRGKSMHHDPSCRSAVVGDRIFFNEFSWLPLGAYFMLIDNNTIGNLY